MKFSGENLRRARQAAGMTQIALAQAAGGGVRTLGYYERGNVCPSVNRAFAMAVALGVGVDVFMSAGIQAESLDSPRTHAGAAWLQAWRETKRR